MSTAKEIKKQIKILLICVLVGFLSGISAVIFRWLVHFFDKVMWIELSKLLSFLGKLNYLFIPMLGLVTVNYLVKNTLTKKNLGHGVTEVIKIIRIKDGKIPYFVAPVEALASSLCIGSGGSVGPEGPMVQIGAGVGSAVGQLFKLKNENLKIAAAAGAAGGLAAIFNAPIAGILFAMEAIVKSFNGNIFLYFVLSSITSTQIYRKLWGNTHLLNIPNAIWGGWQELFIFLLLGIFGGFLGVVFIRFVNKAENSFRNGEYKLFLNPIAGGFLLGIFALFLPQVLSEGYETIESVLKNQFKTDVLIVLLAAKVAATSITLGSGGSGGLFAPSLVLGSLLGGMFSHLAGVFFPNIIGSHETYIAAGIAAVLAGVFNAPLTAVIMVIELSNNYNIALPLMTASVSASYICCLKFKGCSVYDLDLVKEEIK